MKKNIETVFQTWFKSNPDAVFIMDEGGVLLEANDQAVRQFDISHKQLPRLSFFDLFVWPGIEVGIKKAGYKSRVFCEGIHKIRKKDNGPIEINISSVSYGDRNVILCLFRDDTIRFKQNEFAKGQIETIKQHGAQKAFHESDEQYHLIAENTADTITVLDLDLNITYVSPSIMKLRGYSAKEALGHRMDQIFTPASMMQMQKVFADQMDLEKSGEGDPDRTVSLELEEYCKDGSTIWVEIAVSFIRDSTTRSTGILTVTRDITKRKQAEEALKKAHEELKRILGFNEALLSAIPTPVFYKDREGRYLGCNIAFSEFMGVTPDLIKGKTVYELWPDEHAKVNHDKDLELMRNPVRQIYEFKVRDKDGLERPVIYFKNVFRDESDHVAGIVGAFMDITDRVLAEEALHRAHDEMELQIETRTAELKKANEQLAALYKVGQIITAPLHLKEVLDVIALNTALLLGSDTGVILLIDETGETLTIEGAFGLRKEVMTGTRDRVGKSIAGRVVQTGQPIIANDLPNDTRFFNPSAVNEGLLACASVPLVAGGKIIGTLDIHSKTNRHAFNEEHIHILKMLANQAVIAIENARLYEQIKIARDELEIRVQQRTSELVTTNAKLQHGIAELRRAETALWESSQMLRLVLNNMPAFVFWKDRDSVYLGCNNLFAKNAGFSNPEEIIGKTDLDLPWKFAEAESYRADDRLVIKTEIPKLNYEETQLTADGRSTWVRTSKVPFRNVDGDIIGVLGTFEDITERRRIEIELNRSNTLLSAIIEAAPTAIFDLDLDGNVKTVWNPAAEKILGWKAEEVIGKPLPTVAMEQKDEFMLFREQIKMGKTLNGLEVRRLKRDGSPIDYCIYASPLFDFEGIITGNVAVLTDITERKRADREIMHMNRALRMLSNSNQVLIHATDMTSLYHEICRTIVEAGGYLMAWVGFVEHDELKTIRRVAQMGQDSGYFESANLSWADNQHGQNPCGIAIRTGLPCIIHDTQTDPLYTPWREAAAQRGYESIIALPLINEGHTIGTLGIYSGEKDAFNDKEVEILTELADDLAFGISALRSRDKKKQAEDALRDSEERFSAVFRFSPMAIAIFRADNGCLIDVNDVFINTSGYSREELIGRTTAEIGIYLNPTDRDIALQRLNEKGMVESFEFEIRNKAGEIKTVISAITFIDIKGVKHYLALILDITERKKSEESLRLLSTALETAANSIVITDREAKIIWANDAFSKLTGYSLDEAIGKNPRNLVYSGIHSRDFYKHMWETILIGNVWHGEIINKRKNGTLFNEFLTITPVRDESNVIRHFIAVKQDITHQKKAEEELRNAKEKAEESNRLKSAFLATMNHELRTPLNHILGFSDLMRSGAIHENIADYADIIHKSSQNLLEIIEGIFELALAEQSEISLRMQTFKCLDLFLNNKSVLTEILEISGKNDQIELLFNADKDLLMQNITADKTKINQVLINLFKNAVKFTKSGKIEFGIIAEKAGWLTFYVEDTGIGIPEDQHDIVFEFFRQGDDSHTREYGGVGIGLAISQKIAEVMKGTLSLESIPGKGSKFYFKIPISMTNLKSSKFRSENKKIDIQFLQGKTVLIAEDDPVSIDLVKKYLSNTGVLLFEAANGKEVIEKLNINPDIILMDLYMPIIDGYSATRIVKSRRPDIPVIAITAYALSSDRGKAVQAGCDGIITKPLDQRILLGELKKYLQRDYPIK